MSLTQKYYVSFIITGPALGALIAFSTMPALVSFVLGMVVEFGLILAGYYLGKRK